MHVDDLASAVIHIMEHYSDLQHLNVGTGQDLTIRELAHAVALAVGYEGGFDFDTSKPDGTPRKLTDNTRLRALGWAPRISLEEGLADTYRWFLAHHAAAF